LGEEPAISTKNPTLSKELVSIFNDVERVYDNTINSTMNQSWVFCLSELEDSLSQWRGYSDDGNGIAIGFSYEYLASFINSINGNKVDLSCNFKPISYETENASLTMLLGLDKINTALEPALVRFHAINALKSSSKLEPIYKSSSFSEEKEWRLFIQYIVEERKGYDTSSIGTLLESSSEYFCFRDNVSFYTKANRLVSYIPLQITNIGKAIRKIWIGPKADVTKEDIYNVLIQSGYIHNLSLPEIIVQKSASSYH